MKQKNGWVLATRNGKEPITLASLCGGMALYWTEREEGEKLQGWYKSEEEALKAWNVLYKMGVVG